MNNSTTLATARAASSGLPNLDILRAVAVLLVLVDHSAKFFGAPPALLNPLGGIGVYLFFVHTSLVLMLSLERLSTDSTGHLAARFYIRRAFRIYPLSIAFVLLVTVFSIPARNISGPWMLASEPFSIGTFLSNLSLTMNLFGRTPVIGQLWSLPLEVQMYLLLPPLFLLANRVGALGMYLFWILAAIGAFLQQALPLPGIWRLSLAKYVPHFVPGIIAYCLWSARPRVPAWLWPPSLLAMCGACYRFHSYRMAWILCLAVGSALPFFHQVRQPLISRCAHVLAKYSYGIYLGHLFALWLGFAAFRGPFLLQVFVWLAALVIVPVGSFHLIESPFIRAGIRLANALPAKKA